jgi:CRP-like cAMP-binding protein
MTMAGQPAEDGIGNLLLSSLPAEEFTQLAPKLERIAFQLGEVIYEPGAHLNYLYFPTSCVVSLLHTMQDGSTAEMGLTGNDGVVGVALFLGGIDFSNGGDFGFVESLIISRIPSIQVAIPPETASAIADTAQQNPAARLSFLGRSMGTLLAPGGYTVESAPENGHITFQPMNGPLAESRAFVLAARTKFPVAGD